MLPKTSFEERIIRSSTFYINCNVIETAFNRKKLKRKIILLSAIKFERNKNSGKSKTLRENYIANDRFIFTVFIFTIESPTFYKILTLITIKREESSSTTNKAHLLQPDSSRQGLSSTNYT